MNYGAVIKYIHELCFKVVDKSKLQSKTPSIVTLTSDNIKSWKNIESEREGGKASNERTEVRNTVA
jgi:hypothetical protein